MSAVAYVLVFGLLDGLPLALGEMPEELGVVFIGPRRQHRHQRTTLRRQAQRLRAAIRAVIGAKDRVTPDLGGTGTTLGFAEALAERVR